MEQCRSEDKTTNPETDKKDKTPKTQRVYPAFPTLKETEQNPDIVSSDHALIYGEVPLSAITKQKKISKKKSKSILRWLSYNVMGAGAQNNVIRSEETEVMAIARYQRIAKGLKLSANNLKVDVIALQEVTSFLMAKELQKVLGEEWEILPNVDEAVKYSAEQLTCYKKSRLSLCAAKSMQKIENRKFIQSYNKGCVVLDINRALSTTFTFKETKQIIHVHNLWGLYDVFPDFIENHIRALLNNKKEGEVSLVIGDTNSRVAHCDEKERSLTTGIVPVVFNRDYSVGHDVQVVDHPDGGFYSGCNDKFPQIKPEVARIHQIKHRVVDITTGKFFSSNKKYNPSKEELKIWNRFRAILCLDGNYIYHHFKLMITKDTYRPGTILFYENDLKKELSDQDILVRMAATVMNKKAMALP